MSIALRHTCRFVTYPLVSCLIFQLAVLPAWGQQTLTAADAHAPYKQPGLPIEQRVEDLLARMTLQEKVRQLDLYSGAAALMDKQKDATHAADSAAFMPERAQSLWGDLGVGGIHDL